MKPRVLVIDDEQAICASLSFALEDDYFMMTTTDPEEGILIVERERVDIILLDLRIGRYNGLDVLQRIKQKDPSVTVIMMT
ncbi:response regulator, partial [Bacillus xiapuensis]|nr:response regulator [Bacillus xiapuensis]